MELQVVQCPACTERVCGRQGQSGVPELSRAEEYAVQGRDVEGSVRAGQVGTGEAGVAGCDGVCGGQGWHCQEDIGEGGMVEGGD